MREVGLLDVVTDAQGTVGRPQHRYSLAADAPALGFEPPAFPCWPGCCSGSPPAPSWPPPTPSRPAASRGPRRPSAAGAAPAPRRSAPSSAALGFDPASVVDEQGATIAFTRCPFRELAESNPDLVCGLHRGLIEGFATQRGDARVLEFHDLADRSPCQVEIAAGVPVA
jgi:predicted ArsR family transcriptional regulator